MQGTISENLLNVFDRVNRAARRAGRDPREITIVAAAKGVDPKRIKEALASGIKVIGENYVQEAEKKSEKIKSKSIEWHLIGHLQKNKVKNALKLFSVIHTLDSLLLAKELDKRAAEPVQVFIEVNIAREKTKSGVDIEGAVRLAKAVSGLENLRLAGLMCIPPETGSPEATRPYFMTLRRLAERINKEKFPNVFIRHLSMGMSNDFEVAIEEGATFVRIGRAIFGPRE